MRTLAAVLALVACVHAGIWALLQHRETAPNFTGQLASVSYYPFRYTDDPKNALRPTAEQIRADLKAIAPFTRVVRTYSSTDGSELVPPIAAEFGLKVTVGAWLSRDPESNEREIQAALKLANHNSNVNAIVVGNETLLREDMSVDELIKRIQTVKRSSPVPVTTAEIWTVWRDNPKLVSAVDFVAAHILPYWEGADASRALDRSIEFYDQLRQMYPGKRIVIAEFGWPSAGYNYHDANPGRIEQARVIRDFVNWATAYGIDYNIIDAIDQPGKSAEGGVGPYWGLFDASLQPKFAWTGAITDPDYLKQAGLAVLLGVLLSLPILAMAGVTVTQATMLAISANLVGAWFTAIVDFWKGHYFVLGAAFALGLGLTLLVPLIAIALSRLDEIAAIAFGRPPRRLASAPSIVPDGAVSTIEGYTPKVSIHVPACCESPEMLKLTLDSVAGLDYPNLECVVVINNTPDPALWRPVEDHCLTLGDRFKFVQIDKLVGFKAGALRLALAHTAPDAEIIASIDADYVVDSAWLKVLVPLFADPRVGFVQSPQDHRDGDTSLMHHAMNSEYAGFFDIGMVQRNEVNAIVMHGTMCLIRRAAIDGSGGWSSDTIVEDTDLGISMLEHGWLAHYTNRRYGRGLLPDTFDAYKRQRHRWAFGGFQLLRKHWRHLLPQSDGLTREQKREYAIGWLNWMGADSVGVIVALLNIVWVPFVAYTNSGVAVVIGAWFRKWSPAAIAQHAAWLAPFADSLSQGADSLAQFADWLAQFGAVPDRILTLPIIAAFAVSVAHFISLYRLRVRASFGEMVGAVFAAMSLQWTVARAVGTGVLNEHMPFLRTAKGGMGRKGADFPAFWEAVISGLLLTGATTLVVTNYKQVHEIDIFAAVLVVQSLPFLAAVALAGIEGTRFNSFVYWRGIEAKIEAKAAVILPQSQEVMTKVIEPAKPADNIETAQ
ncbi:MAG TPA: glycosyltransferase [Xanthobacteraceae bacterium]|jgi:exo-beta-1,3-glucanase (GH17 family)/glycosyltransferase involved in cell wall biosynthesis|nr:glycosyltransferase [Xanthobacteraceae bacterium]